ncbi:MAG: rhodanese-like domain-containing protein [Chitinophagaceae bacterium]|nr:rhodanese-like domain-containing protein [Chitinophagaceae bacterium]
MQTISVAELKARKEAGEELFILDVREPSEYAEVNMGAKLIPLGQIMNMQVDEIEDWKEHEVIVHCRSGVRSMQACAMLDQMGFTNTKNLTGGINAWVELNQA